MLIISRSEAISSGLARYYTGKPCKHGHICERTISSGCCECHRIKVNKQSKTRDRCTERERKRKRNWYLKNRDSEIKRRRRYREENKDVEFIRRSLERTLSGINLGHTDYFSVLGYDRKQLREHLESMFVDGMSWSNYGDWHIDHIRSISSLKKLGITDPSVVNALSNLQPLWAIENLRKGA